MTHLCDPQVGFLLGLGFRQALLKDVSLCTLRECILDLVFPHESGHGLGQVVLTCTVVYRLASIFLLAVGILVWIGSCWSVVGALWRCRGVAVALPERLRDPTPVPPRVPTWG